MPIDSASTPNASSSNAKPWRHAWWKRTPWWVKSLALPLALGFGSMTGLLVALQVLPLPDQSFVDPTRVETEDGQTLAEWTLKGTRTEPVPLNRVPVSLKQATLAVEDAQFYHHHAFQLTSMARAFLVDVGHGKVVEGGSTITQQLAKNLFLNQDRTMTRKFKEALLAIQLELHESKDDILSQYLNTVYYGHGAYGINAAARLYFDKPVSDLTLAQSALLAGLPKGPSLYSPLQHPERAKARQHIVLERMVKAGYLTEAEAEAAWNEPLHYHQSPQPNADAPYFTSTAVHEAERSYHLTPDDLYRGGIRLTTTLDPVLQQAAEHAVSTTLAKHPGLQAAVVAMDPQTGAIKAMVGGRDFTTSPYNRVFAERQPGSTFKAILYTAALSHDWVPTHQVQSEMTTFLYDKSKLYTVHDYGEFYAHRPLTMREAIAKSDNVYAVTTNLEVGPSDVVQEAHAMGITTPLKPYPALALGVFPVSPLQMASAYAVLANGGYTVQPYTVQSVRRVDSPDEQHAPTPHRRVVDSKVAFQLSDLMTSVVKPGGTGYRVHPYLHGKVAAKTGTTDTDAWMVGYTPKLVCAVWVGYDSNKPLSQPESHLAAPIWGKFMGMAENRLPSDWYQPPVGLEKHVIDPVTGQLATDQCKTTEVDWFRPGTAPTEWCALHPASDSGLSGGSDGSNGSGASGDGSPNSGGDSQGASGSTAHTHWWQRWMQKLHPRS